MSPQRRRYRLVVFALVLFYFLDRFTAEIFVLDNFGWQFRYLTIWALSLSLISAGLMLTDRFGRADGRGAVFVALTAVVNLIVVISYWRLYATDPAMVNGGREIVVWREWYLHALGPALQWIDALALKRALRRPGRVALALLALVAVYVVWAEAVVAPLNDAPVGTVTAGLPYPFLNDMAPAARAVFYAQTCALGLVCVLGLWGLQIGLDRARGAQPAGSAASTAARPLR